MCTTTGRGFNSPHQQYLSTQRRHADFLTTYLIMIFWLPYHDHCHPQPPFSFLALLQSFPPLIPLPFPSFNPLSITPPPTVSSLHLAGSYSNVDGSTVCTECSPGLICKYVCLCVCVCVCVCECVECVCVRPSVLSSHLSPERSLLTSAATDSELDQFP